MKKTNIFLTTLLLAIATLMTACGEISEEQRFIYVEPTATARAVLLEDFTGQKCVNCPDAHEEIERLQKEYGADSVIAVSIHAGPLAVKPTNKTVGLRTDLGDEYFKAWKIEVQPSGIINRTGKVSTRMEWAGRINEERQKKTPLQMTMENRYDEKNRQLDIEINTATIADIQGKLQLWITEDSIVAMQLMPDGKAKKDYVQNHVLRAAVNGTWGTDIQLGKGQAAKSGFGIKINEKWKPENIAVVAFVYNDEGVMQVIRKKITN